MLLGLIVVTFLPVMLRDSKPKLVYNLNSYKAFSLGTPSHLYMVPVETEKSDT